MNNKRTKAFSLSTYVEQALRLAEYEKDENGTIVAHVPNVPGFFLRAIVLKRRMIIFGMPSRAI